MQPTKKQQLLSHLEGFADSLRNDWMTTDQVAKSLIIIAESYGAVQKVGELYYFKPMTPLPRDQEMKVETEEYRREERNIIPRTKVQGF